MNSSNQVNNEHSAGHSYDPVKLEDINTIDLLPSHIYSWQQHNSDHQRIFINTPNRLISNNTKLLLQGSDDPLISHGANHDDEHPADFAKYLNTHNGSRLQVTTVDKQSNQEGLGTKPNDTSNTPTQRPVKSGCSNLTKQQLKAKANLMSARNQEQQRNQNNNISSSHPIQQRSEKAKNKKGTTVRLKFHHQALPPEYLSHFEAKQAQHRSAQNQPKLKTTNQRSSSATKSGNTANKQSQPRNSNENVRSWLKRIAEIQRNANACKEEHHCQRNPEKTTELPRTTTHTQSGPERQNIVNDAHFRSEGNNNSNYKHSFHADLPYMGEITLDNYKPRRGRKPKKADICHLINKNYRTENRCNYSSAFVHNKEKNHVNKIEEYCEQPLNLCVRDQQKDSYSISSGDELSETNSSCPTPVSNPLDYARDSALAKSLENSLNNINEPSTHLIAAKTAHKPAISSKGGDKVMHSIAMYYQKLLESTNGLSFKTIQKDNQLALKIPIPTGLFAGQDTEKTSTSSSTTNLVNAEPLLTTTRDSLKSELSLTSHTVCESDQKQPIVAEKRKRSAIFIPPMNIENTTNPVTEVSICKFKFTGGSKPSLQKKKMVSVDAGGNYCYFSGTGDKATQEYEYFSRESLQHTAGLLPGVNCIGTKVSLDIPPTTK